MASQDRTAAVDVMQQLLGHYKRFSFFQAVRLLEHWRPQSVPLGREGPADREGIRFRAQASLAFPASDIADIDLRDEPFPHLRITVNFLGLYGPASPLPAFYTEEIIDAENADPEENTLRFFLDGMFHHRLISLLYRCWEKYRYYVQFRPGATDQVSQWMFALLGLGDPRTREESPISWPRLLPFLGLLSMKTHSASVVASVVSHYFGGVPAHIAQCVLRWVPFADEQRNALGQTNCTLGEDSTLGSRFSDRSGKCRLRLGALDFATFQQFVPAGEEHAAVCELVRFGMRDQLEFDLELILRASEIPALTLSEDTPCRLGWSTWLAPRPERDVSVVFPVRMP
jgi:type VI secretion system protein ImpH